MKVVIDTNVIASAAFRDADPQAVVDFVAGTIGVEWVGSHEIIAEYLEVLAHPKFSLSRATIDEWHARFARIVRLFPPAPDVRFPPDPSDAKFLACALATGADYLLTGDRKLLDAGTFGNTVILSVRTFGASVMHRRSPHTNGG